MNKLFPFIIIFLTSCSNNNTSKTKLKASEKESIKSENSIESHFDKSIDVPKGYKIIGEATGDLNKDKIEEKVIVYNTDRNEDMGIIREIHIFKKGKSTWEKWHSSIGAVLPSNHGGMMGDPFEEVKVENGCLVIRQSGGSREKWSYTHRYRNQNNSWELIGATINYYTPEDFSETLDYNLSNGKISYSKEIDLTYKETPTENKNIKLDFIKKLKTLPKMHGFYPGNNQITLPENIGTFYY